jgi:hypothetical protein
MDNGSRVDYTQAYRMSHIDLALNPVCRHGLIFTAISEF